MRGKFGEQLWRDGFAIEPLLQHVERLHAAIAHDQELAVDGAGQMQRVEEIGKAFGNILAGARIKPRDEMTAMLVVRVPGDRLHADAVPFPFRHELRRVEVLQIGIVERMRQHRRAERRRIAARRLLGAAFEPGEQLAIGRREAGPDQLDLLRILVGQRGDGGLGQPRRNADAQAAGDELDQRPAAGLVERIEPARQLLRQLRLAERGEGFDHGGEGKFSFPPPRRERMNWATSARRFRTGRRHNRRTIRTAPDRCVRRSGCGSGPAWHAGSSSSPVSAASAQPRSGSGVVRK